MDRLLSRRSAVCRAVRGLHATFPSAQQCPQTMLESAVLSGFPTAVEPSLPRLLPGTNASAMPSDQRGSQLPLPRDDIPPAPAVTLGVCRLRLARMWFPLTLRPHSRVQYG